MNIRYYFDFKHLAHMCAGSKELAYFEQGHGFKLTRNPLSARNPRFLLHLALHQSMGLFSETHVGVEF